jgi:hypothetical protein
MDIKMGDMRNSSRKNARTNSSAQPAGARARSCHTTAIDVGPILQNSHLKNSNDGFLYLFLKYAINVH